MSLLFKPEHIDQIRNGTKTVTRRDWSSNYARPNEGTVQMATPEMFTTEEECDCFIRIESVYDQPLGEMTEDDAAAEGGYTLPEFRDVWERINGDGSWNPDQEVVVVEFEYVGRSRDA